MISLIFILAFLSQSALARECTAEQYLVDGKLLSLDPATGTDDPAAPNRYAVFGTNEIPEYGFGDPICRACGWGSKATDFRFGRDRGLASVIILDKNGNIVGLDTSGKSFKVLSEITCQK